jgi:hypothetical protein
MGPHELAVDLDAQTLELFGAGGALLDAVTLVPLAQRLGGVRWVMCCPGCWRRARTLYAPGAHLHYRCRACHRLAYRSQRLGETARWERRAAKLYARAGGRDADGWTWRPKGMHRATFERIVDAAEEWDDAALGRSLIALARRIPALRSTLARLR